MIQINFPPFGAKSVHLSVNLPRGATPIALSWCVLTMARFADPLERRMQRLLARAMPARGPRVWSAHLDGRTELAPVLESYIRPGDTLIVEDQMEGYFGDDLPSVGQHISTWINKRPLTLYERTEKPG